MSPVLIGLLVAGGIAVAVGMRKKGAAKDEAARFPFGPPNLWAGQSEDYAVGEWDFRVRRDPTGAVHIIARPRGQTETTGRVTFDTDGQLVSVEGQRETLQTIRQMIERLPEKFGTYRADQVVAIAVTEGDGEP